MHSSLNKFAAVVEMRVERLLLSAPARAAIGTESKGEYLGKFGEKMVALNFLWVCAKGIVRLFLLWVLLLFGEQCPDIFKKYIWKVWSLKVNGLMFCFMSCKWQTPRNHMRMIFSFIVRHSCFCEVNEL